MMSNAELIQVITKIRYKAGWFIHLDWTGETPWLQWRFYAPDPSTGRTEVQHCRKWRLSPHMTPSEVVQTAFAAVLAAEEHEAREIFSYKGVAVLQPHLDLDELVARATITSVRS